MKHEPASLGMSVFGLLVAFALIGPGGTTSASQVRPVNLEEMSQAAAIIFSGRCVGVEVRLDPQLGRKVSVATFEVNRVVKGEPGERVELKMLRSSSGAARFRAGEEVVLFLYGTSELGLSSPVGLGQGKFTVVEDKLGRKLAINRFGNKHLTRGLSAQARGRLGDAGPDLKGTQEVEPSTLLDLVELLGP